MLEQPVRALAGPLQETRLHRPDLPHVGAETVRDREVSPPAPSSRGPSPVQRRYRRHALRFLHLPLGLYLGPQQRGEQEARLQRLAGRGRARRCWRARPSQTVSPAAAPMPASSRRQHAVMQALLAQCFTASAAWPESRSFSISSSSRDGGTCASSPARRWIGRRVAASTPARYSQQTAPRAACVSGPRGNAAPGRR